MKNEVFSEISHQPLFTVFDSNKQKKTDMFRIHHHTELEIGFIESGEGNYIIDGVSYNAKAGDVFLVRSNEQHCVPTIHTPFLTSLNIHLTSYYLWNICSEYISSDKLLALSGNSVAIQHRFVGFESNFKQLSSALREGNTFLLRRLVLSIIESISDETQPAVESSAFFTTAHLDHIQNSIFFINANLREEITLEQIAQQANLSCSQFSALFKCITGIAPYSYLILRRIENATLLLRNTDKSVLTVSQECGFFNLSNFNKAFKKITGLTPREYRLSKRTIFSDETSFRTE